jgi:hypothetical protein
MTIEEGFVYCPHIPDPSQVFDKQKFEAKVGYKKRKELEELQKYLDDNNINFEEYLRSNMITDEERKYFDKIWMDAIYRNFGDT